MSDFTPGTAHDHTAVIGQGLWGGVPQVGRRSLAFGVAVPCDALSDGAGGRRRLRGDSDTVDDVFGALAGRQSRE